MGLTAVRVLLDAGLLVLATAIQLAASAHAQGVWWLFPPVAMVALAWGGRYRPAVWADPLGGVAAAVTATAVGAFSVVVVVTMVGTGTVEESRLVQLWGLSTAFVIAGQLLLAYGRSWIRSGESGGTPTLIVGAGEVGVSVERRLLERRELGLRPVGFLDEAAGQEEPPSGRRAPLLGTSVQLERIARETGAGHVVVAFARAPDHVVAPVVRACSQAGVSVSVVPRMFESKNSRVTVEDLGGLPLHTLHGTNPKGWRFAVKHAFDRLAAAFLLVLLLPMFAGIAAAIKLSTPCPVFFRQRRIGRDGREFEMWKFSTMCGTAHACRNANGSWAAEMLGERRTAVAEPTDQRTTVGRFLRRFSLDELPQLFNVLSGEMSLVGPRPEQVPYVRRFERKIHRYGERHRVRSGMTGWAQIKGLRGCTPLVDRVEADNFYVENWSWSLDLKILALTTLAVLRSPADATATAAQAGGRSEVAVVRDP